MFLARIADLALNRPLLLTPDKAQVILAVLAGRFGVGQPEASRFEGSPVVSDGGKVAVRPYNVTPSGVAIVTVTGSLVNRGAWIGANSGLTSYEGIQHQLKTAMADPAVKAVILDLHSPGGEAVGAFETAAMVRQLAAKKRTFAVVNGMAASAAYAIASGATEIVTTESGMSGSIGVVLLHADFSRKLEKDGVKPTLIFAGARKADGNPFEPLPQEVRESLQREVDGIYTLFVTTVAGGRGARLSEAAARATEGRMMMGKAAVAAGLADRVGTFDQVLAELSASPAKVAASAPARPAAASPAAGNGMTAATADSVAARMAPPFAVAPANPVKAARLAEWNGSAALRAQWPEFSRFDAFLDAARARAMARKG